MRFVDHPLFEFRNEPGTDSSLSWPTTIPRNNYRHMLCRWRTEETVCYARTNAIYGRRALVSAFLLDLYSRRVARVYATIVHQTQREITKKIFPIHEQLRYSSNSYYYASKGDRTEKRKLMISVFLRITRPQLSLKLSQGVQRRPMRLNSRTFPVQFPQAWMIFVTIYWGFPQKIGVIIIYTR